MISLREEQQLSQAELARLAGVGQSTINRLENGDTRAPRQILTLAKVLNCSVDYLLDASDDRGGDASLAAAPRSYKSRTLDPDIVELDEVNLSYGLGGAYIDGPVSSEKRRFSRAWLRNMTHAAPDELFWTKGQGDSMEPTIRSGEIVLVDRSDRTPRLGDGIWAIAWGEIGMIKRLRPRPDGTVDILSDNKLVPIATAADGELHVVGRVIAVIRKL